MKYLLRGALACTLLFYAGSSLAATASAPLESGQR